MATGATTPQIAQLLFVSAETVRTHTKRIFAKLGVTDRTAAVKVALLRGIVHVPLIVWRVCDVLLLLPVAEGVWRFLRVVRPQCYGSFRHARKLL